MVDVLCPLNRADGIQTLQKSILWVINIMEITDFCNNKLFISGNLCEV